jgi:hypothetical protein
MLIATLCCADPPAVDAPAPLAGLLVELDYEALKVNTKQTAICTVAVWQTLRGRGLPSSTFPALNLSRFCH